MFLLIDNYKSHNEDFRLFTDREQAIAEAEKLAADYPQDWTADYSGDGIIFGRQGEEPSWHVEVREIEPQ